MRTSLQYLQASPGVSVEVETPGRPRGVGLLLSHGAGSDLASAGLLALGAGLAAQGHPCARFNLPFREAAAKAMPPPAEESVAAYMETFDHLRHQLGPRRRFAAGGRSYGGRVASMAVAKGMPAVALVFYSYPLHPPGKPDEPRVAHWPDILVPCLFLVGTEDEYCDLKLLKRYVKKLGGGADIQVVEGGDHALEVSAREAEDGQKHDEAEVLGVLSGIVSGWLRAL